MVLVLSFCCFVIVVIRHSFMTTVYSTRFPNRGVTCLSIILSYTFYTFLSSFCPFPILSVKVSAPRHLPLPHSLANGRDPRSFTALCTEMSWFRFLPYFNFHWSRRSLVVLVYNDFSRTLQKKKLPFHCYRKIFWDKTFMYVLCTLVKTFNKNITLFCCIRNNHFLEPPDRPI